MALSQYVAINFLTKFDKKGLERATKELKGFDKVVATGSFRLRAFAKAGGVAAVAGLAIFTKQSIQAALAQEKLDKQLQLTLKSIGQEFALPDVKNFVADLQQATNVTEDQLVPALQQLITQTGNLESAQALLTTALDVSAGTGQDLSGVLDGITKAAVGNYKVIGNLGIGFTAAQAKALGFAGIMQELAKYTGDAEEATLTFNGQIKSFKISAGEATETLGQGFLTAYAIISGGGPLIKNLGTDLEVVAKQFSNIIVGIAATTKEKGLGVYGELAKVFLQGFVGETSALQNLEKAGLKALNTENQTANQREGRVSATKKLLTYEEIIANIQKNILKNEKLTTKEKAAQTALDKKKAELSAMFDLDKINLQVSLTRKLSAEDELRVKILQKLADGTTAAVNEAQRYVDVLKVIDDGKISDAEIATLAKTWGITTTEVVLYISKLMTANDELRKMIGLASQVNVGTPSVAATSTDKYDEIKKSLEKEFISRGIEKGAASGLAASSVRLQAQADAYFKANPDIDPLTGGRRVPLAEGGIVTRPTNALIGEAGAEAVIPLDRMGGFGTTVNVNVAGSVISEGELQSVIQDALYNLNRAGAVTQLTNLGR
jgi:hypothetical protein